MGMMVGAPDGVVALADVEPVAELLKSLANPHRLMIVCTLVEGERAVSELERDLDIRQPSLSQHLASLREAGLVVGRREAKAVFYRLADARAASLVEALHEIFCQPARRDRRGAGAPSPRGSRPRVEMRPSRTPVGDAAFFARIGASEER